MENRLIGWRLLFNDDFQVRPQNNFGRQDDCEWRLGSDCEVAVAYLRYYPEGGRSIL